MLFRSRYKTVDQLLETVNPSNILELSSGFSCRGLAFARYRPVVYIDTDLPESSANKKELVNRLIEAQAIAFKGELHILPLNALDEEQFRAIMEIFPPGPVTIVNEGLLVYLDEQEKRKLCGIIHRVLHERGGCWITGDVYIRDPKRESITDGSDLLEERWSAFLREHKVEENKFATYEEASNFFASCGFRVSRKAEVKVKELSAMRFLPETVTEETVKHWVRNQQTWMLEAV